MAGRFFTIQTTRNQNDLCVLDYGKKKKYFENTEVERVRKMKNSNALRWGIKWCSNFGRQFNTIFLMNIHIPTAAKSLQSCPTLCDTTDGSPVTHQFSSSIHTREILGSVYQKSKTHIKILVPFHPRL